MVQARVGGVAALLMIAALVSTARAAERPAPAWVEVSNAATRIVLEAQAAFFPEAASGRGLAGHDGRVVDLGPRHGARYVAAIEDAVGALRRRHAAERDPNVRQDLEILLDAMADEVAGTRLFERHFLEWHDAPKMVFAGVKTLLDAQVAPARRAHASERLARYVGRFSGATALTELARARFSESRSPARIGPYRRSVEEAIANAPTYARGVRNLFTEFEIPDAEAALAALDAQVAAWAAWAKKTVLPLARTDFRQPPDVYAFLLDGTGIDVGPRTLARRAQAAFLETRGAMEALAPLVAKAHGLEARDYRDVIRALKRQALPDAELVARYTEVNRALEAIIRRERIASLPARPMVMRLASEAESAAQPAPHMRPPPLIGNTGERGQFVLPLGNPMAAGSGEAYDDFNFPAATWTLSAHEGRPGHELQFTAMVEQGVSQARSLFAFNSVNVEGWALYAEAEVLPYEPIDGQLIALQFRLLRAARAMLDPLLNLGLMDVAAVARVLRDDVVLSEAMIRQEIDRYTFRAPGQAGSYFYGYTRILELRAAAELALGRGFDRMVFNDFLLAQGLLPPPLLERAVHEELIARGRRER